MLESEPPNAPVALYVASIECPPAAPYVCLQAAAPPLTGTAPHPAIGLPPSVNATVPVAVLGSIVAVYVTGCPGTPVPGEAPSVVVVVVAQLEKPDVRLALLLVDVAVRP